MMRGRWPGLALLALVACTGGAQPGGARTKNVDGGAPALVPTADDRDGDGLSNSDEVAAGTDPDDKDSDKDGLPDGFEVHDVRTNPLKPDSDGDGIWDGEEVRTLKTDPNVPDLDHPRSKETLGDAGGVEGAPEGPSGPSGPSGPRGPKRKEGTPVTGKPGPDGVQGVGGDAVGPDGAPVAAAGGIEAALRPVDPVPAPAGVAGPPPSLRCAATSAVDCFVYVPEMSGLLGAQAADPAGPGHDPLARADEGPVREVRTSAFWIQRHEVTAAAFSRCVRAGACPAEAVGKGSSVDDAARRDHPATAVTWAGARAYCQFLGGDLPTEAQWERAARGPTTRRFPWGELPLCGVGFPAGVAPAPQKACALDGTVAVDAERGDAVTGARGLGGNAAEWVRDAYAVTAYATRADTDPFVDGPGDRVLRGGSFTATDPNDLRAARRDHAPPGEQRADIGFRCAFAAN
jgi:sulfatase modifying factor 1